MKIAELTEEFTTVRYVLYIKDKPVAHYSNEHEAAEQMTLVKKKFPDVKMEIKKKIINTL